jgi:hypothetical protein
MAALFLSGKIRCFEWLHEKRKNEETKKNESRFMG